MALSWTTSNSSPPGSLITDLERSQDRQTFDRRSFDQLAQRVRAEYLEMPGLNVTREQARCLWALDSELCDRVLAHLVGSGFLVRTSQNTYVRVG